MRAYERLIEYAKIHTGSAEGRQTTPSTAYQFDLARVLERELRDLGVQDVFLDEQSYVYGRLPPTPGLEKGTRVGFLAHLDTAPDFRGEGVRPRVVEQYDGTDIRLGESGRVLSPRDFPHLKALQGQTLVVTDGTTLLGADDKAGIAEIMTAVERLQTLGVPHGPVSVCFCPDEEIGHGAAALDLDRFGAELAYTLDGGAFGEIQDETFNAAAATVTVRGFPVHPGSAKDTMINASAVAVEFCGMLPAGETPRNTEGREGFFHLTDLSGTVGQAQLHFIIRDHDSGAFQARKNTMRHIVKLLNARYGPGTVTLEIQDQYRNMMEVLRQRPDVMQVAMEATRACGVDPIAVPIRGGTDGAQLSFRGLPCPNLPTGSFAHHGPYEHASAEQMDQCTDLVLRIIDAFK